jgi:monothiol glutaredoxin
MEGAMGVIERLRRLVGGFGADQALRAGDAGGSNVGSGSNSPFKIASQDEQVLGAPVREQDPAASNEERIDRMVNSSEVFLFIKGTPQQPLCGFSANTVAIVDTLGVPYSTFDVLSDERIRQAAKAFSQWPTFPQVYVRGEFVGGNDIVTEMYTRGELQTMMTEVVS